ncbi:G6PDH family F420-dependent oxidoreductase [Amycolatopsis bartoniae]|uniref:LLM class F420-dependent oxidoreductase n=1 Tax=Amycolatopsis bartoniae TaxID=941986 RepID=A0A8H9MGB4_9PSEU|nr:TIGR03557 family F420-dependent LLM class oxidoreductase [Amycolatopsis bartoniae]MBB2936285.1 G6PDH family F420-dependent oxidoreductase [Amycolatopsis bartoniae]TVT11560.1 TIGR03557 family F420-dependent LLM class oxidoreductase [Amycolatopsis bartoniae]GHF79097.1 LLM class F420-dependent oxidoreductase [Amycolatopsis bartoniae]
MVSIGYFLSCEEFGPQELVEQAKQAEQAGFERLWISDHFHPWLDEQGQSPFVWSVIGALSQVTSLPITTAVTCPTIRIHPAIVAQAAATAAVQCRGGFTLGVGSGEALNEHVLGDHWPPPDERLEMLDEAIDVIRELHTGKLVNHRGKHYTVEQARIYTLPEEPVPIYVSAFGPKAISHAAKTADGLCTVMPDAELVKRYRDEGGRGPIQGGFKACWAESEEQGRKTAHRKWPNDLLPGNLPRNLPIPSEFAAASTLVTEEAVGESIPCGPDPDKYVQQVRKFADAGFDEVYVQQIGSDHDKFFEAWSSKVLPEFR